jgi:hypothetical protein
MSTAELRVIYRPDEDGTGEIIATVKSGVFGAEGSAWFGRGLKTFLTDLRCFPLTSENPPQIEGGFWNERGRELWNTERASLKQCHLRICIKPYGSRGTLLVHIELASPFWTSPDDDLQNSATVRFLTEYAAVARFADQFEKVLDGEMDEAILLGSTSRRGL